MTLHPLMAAALAPFAPPLSGLRRKPEPVEYEEGYCASCSGSGEGMWDGSTCHACKGTGSQWFQVEAAGPDEDEDEKEFA